MHAPHLHLRAYIILLVVLLVLAGVLFFMHVGGEVKPSVPYTPTRGDVPQGIPAAAPAPTPADFTDQQVPFQELISFVGSGFVPSSLEANAGETVRFTNNSRTSIVVMTDGTSSPTLKPGEYWQHRYRKVGTFDYAYGTMHGTIITK